MDTVRDATLDDLIRRVRYGNDQIADMTNRIVALYGKVENFSSYAARDADIRRIRHLDDEITRITAEVAHLNDKIANRKS